MWDRLLEVSKIICRGCLFRVYRQEVQRVEDGMTDGLSYAAWLDSSPVSKKKEEML